MFPFQSDELPFQISNDVDNTNSFTNTCPTTPNHFVQPHLINNTSTNLVINNTNNNEISGNNVAKKRVTHREVERKRRQDMSNLQSSLRSLLPVEYIKGKRSVCDHVGEAAKYITELEKNVKELAEKRETLKNSPPSTEHQQPSIIRDRDFGWSSSSSSTTTSTSSEYNVSIHKFSKTLQIEIAAVSGVGDEDPYPLSKALRVLANEGLDVVSCDSSKANQSWIYVIYCEIDDMTLVDTSNLQQKLMSVFSSSDT